MNDLKETIAKNLTELRTRAKLTQVQLAEMLNYSDKAVSKWERGEAIPDLRVLIRLSQIYGVTLDELVGAETPAVQPKPQKHQRGMRAFITAMSAVLVWFVATWLFMLFYFITPTEEYAWLVFVVAPLPMSIVLTVFSAIWGNRITNAVASSMIVWSCALIIYIFVWKFAPEFKQIFFVWIVAGVFEILVILWFTYRWYVSKYGKLIFKKSK